MDSSSDVSSRAPEPVGPYSHFRRAGGLLFLAGIGPRVRGMKEVPGVRLGMSPRDVRDRFAESAADSSLMLVSGVLRSRA